MFTHQHRRLNWESPIRQFLDNLKFRSDSLLPLILLVRVFPYDGGNSRLPPFPFLILPIAAPINPLFRNFRRMSTNPLFPKFPKLEFHFLSPPPSFGFSLNPSQPIINPIGVSKYPTIATYLTCALPFFRIARESIDNFYDRPFLFRFFFQSRFILFEIAEKSIKRPIVETVRIFIGEVIYISTAYSLLHLLAPSFPVGNYSI